MPTYIAGEISDGRRFCVGFLVEVQGLMPDACSALSHPCYCRGIGACVVYKPIEYGGVLRCTRGGLLLEGFGVYEFSCVSRTYPRIQEFAPVG